MGREAGRGWRKIKLRGAGQELQPAHSLSLPLPLALDQAKQDLRFLLVYLHSPGHQDTFQFCM